MQHRIRKAVYQAVCFIFLLIGSLCVSAQVDTIKQPSVSIISTYKPVLRFAAKNNFYPSQLVSDSSLKSISPYAIPDLNLMYGYQSVSIPSMELLKRKNDFLNNNFIKIGYGMYSSPLLHAGFNYNKFKNTVLHASIQYNSSKGKIVNQDYSMFSGKISGSYFLKHHEVSSSLQYNARQNYLYGYDHLKFEFAKSDITHNFQEFTYKIGLKNTTLNKWNINYHPQFEFDAFSLKDSINENTFSMNIPVEYTFSKSLSFSFTSNIDLTKISTQHHVLNDTSFTNNVLSVSPGVKFEHNLFSVNANVMLASVDKRTVLLPQVLFEVPFHQKKYIFRAGIIGQVNKNTFRNLTLINPYLFISKPIENARSVEFYTGINAVLGKHFFVNTKIGLVSYKNYGIMINDTSTEERMKGFVLSKEDALNDFKIHADISYLLPEKISLTAGCSIHIYSGLQNNAKAWNLPIVEGNAGFAWNFKKSFTLNANMSLFGGGYYLDRGNQENTLKGSIDLGVELSYHFNKRIDAFIRINNIFGENYERWHNYPVYGTSALGGIKFSF